MQLQAGGLGAPAAAGGPALEFVVVEAAVGDVVRIVDGGFGGLGRERKDPRRLGQLAGKISRRTR